MAFYDLSRVRSLGEKWGAEAKVIICSFFDISMQGDSPAIKVDLSVNTSHPLILRLKFTQDPTSALTKKRTYLICPYLF